MMLISGHLRDEGDLRPSAGRLRYPRAEGGGADGEGADATSERHRRRRPHALLARHHITRRRQGMHNVLFTDLVDKNWPGVA